MVKVREPAVGGRATEAALRALADALGIRRSAVELVAGSTSRHKVVELHGDAGVLGPRVAELLVAGNGGTPGH